MCIFPIAFVYPPGVVVVVVVSIANINKSAHTHEIIFLRDSLGSRVGRLCVDLGFSRMW